MVERVVDGQGLTFDVNWQNIIRAWERCMSSLRSGVGVEVVGPARAQLAGHETRAAWWIVRIIRRLSFR